MISQLFDAIDVSHELSATLKHFITDGLPAYMKSSKRIFGKDTLRTRHIHLKGDAQNNKMERFNGSFRDREQVFRGLKKTRQFYY